MARTVPGSGAVIEPIFDEVFGVRAVEVKNGGTGYSVSDPPRLTVNGCGTPDRAAVLYPIIDDDSGRITHVRVLDRGLGYDPLRLQITPLQETPNIVTSFDVKRVFQDHPNSPLTTTFQSSGTPPVLNDRLAIVADNHPKPTWTQAEAAPGGGPLVDRTFNQQFVYRGGKDVPNPGTRELQQDKVTGILANGGLLHTPEWGVDGNAPPGHQIDAVKNGNVKSKSAYDTVVESNVQYYHSSKTINEFATTNGVFEWGKLRHFTWKVKVETDNIMLQVTDVDETLGNVEVGRLVDEVGGNARGEVSKVVRDGSNNVTRVYLRDLTPDHAFANNDSCLGANGFTFKVSAVPTTFTNGAYYFEFGENASEFGPFIQNAYYFSPENIKVKANWLIKLDQSDSSNAGHQIQFSTTPDGPNNSTPGTIYYKSSGVSDAPAADYENELQPIFVMNSDETGSIYYYCKNHAYSAGFTGDAGYIKLDTAADTLPALTNTYYTTDFYATGPDYSRHVDGHSKILGMSYDGFPIYGPWGYDASGTVIRQKPDYRLRTTPELAGSRPIVTTASTVNYTVTIASGKYLFSGSTPSFLSFERGKTYVFNCNDSSCDSQQLLISTQEDGWHSGNPVVIGDTSVLYGDIGVTYQIDGSDVSYTAYLSGFNGATTRGVTFTIPPTAPTALYIFAYTTAGHGVRTVQDGYILGDLIGDWIDDESAAWASASTYAQYDTVTNASKIYEATAAISSGGSAPTHTSGTTSNWKYLADVGTLDQYNGKYAVTPEYPNGTYCYWMTEDSSGNPIYPYAIGPRFYGAPLFEGDTVPTLPAVFPTVAEGNVVLSADNPGQVSYIKMTRMGDNYFGPASARILGGQGTGALGSPTVQTITGLSLINAGREYATPPTLIFEGGGGQDAQGAAEIDTLGRITSITVSNTGEYYQEPPYVLITGGGGGGAKAIATVSQGSITGITVTEPGNGYTTEPKVILTKLVNLKRKTRARQAFNSGAIYLTGLVKDVTANDAIIYVDSTDAYPGSGSVILNTETITYTSKAAGKFSGLTRGVNFNYDQRLILDSGQNDSQGNSTYQFSVGDQVIRKVENANNKIAKVYDWNSATRELLVTFEIDELAFIDGGIPSTEDAIVQFDAGVAAASGSGVLPHTVLTTTGSTITALTEPITTIADRSFQDILPTSAGDGIPDLINTSTEFENQIALDGGIYDSLYGIEETQGGQNTTLFQVGDNIKDGSIPFKYATVGTAGALADGVEHTALVKMYLDANNANGQNFSVNEIVTGSVSGVRGTVVSWDPTEVSIQIKDVIPYNTGDVNVGIAGYLYKFSEKGTIVDYYIQNSGTNYSSTPSVTIENTGDIQATATAVMSTQGDQVASITITNGGYGIEQTVDNSYALHPTVTIAAPGSGVTAKAYAILGGENLVGNGGATYRIKRIEYQATLRSK